MLTIPVGLLRDLPPKRVMRAQVQGQDLVVWRATDGDISAWSNRCPHRGMALSHGFVRGNDLACLYHGWHYGSAGVCRYIPAHPELDPPATITAQVFCVVEADGVIWVNSGGVAKPVPVPISSQPLRSFFVEAGSDDIAEASQATLFEGVLPAPLGGGLYQLGARQVVLLENPRDADQTQTQITVLADAAATPAHCMALSRWCEAMRSAALSMQVAA